MIVPGSNLLSMALTIIGQTPVEYLRCTGRTQNAAGQWIPAYAAAVAVWGSWQPVEKAKYAELGLDMSKKHFAFFSSTDITPVEREESGDLIHWNGRRHQVIDDADWFLLDGWTGVICVDIGPVPVSPPPPEPEPEPEDPEP